MFIGTNAVLPPQPMTYSVTLAPVYNVLNSISGLINTKSNPGLDEWLIETQRSLVPEIRELHEQIFSVCGVEAIANLVADEPHVVTFPDYLEAIDTLDAGEMVRRVIYWMCHSSHHRVYQVDEELYPKPQFSSEIFDDAQTYERFVREYSQHFDDDIAAASYKRAMQAYERFIDPHRLKRELVALLTHLWETYYAAEWARVEPVLREAVTMLSRIDTSAVPPFEAMQAIIGRDLRTVFIAEELATFEHIEFIPSLHNGPYITWFGDDKTLRIVFGARIPAQMRQGNDTSALDHVEFINQLKAMGDDTRLHILIHLGRYDELTTAQLMETFDLNKSAASRHLRSLHASGLIRERRDSDNKTKRYSLNNEGVYAMIDALHNLLD